MTIRRTIMEPNFDSVLNPASGGDAAKLTIAIRVGLVPLDPRAGGSQPVRMSPGPAYLAHGAADMQSGNVVDVNGTAVKCHSWTAPEWNAFQIQFKQVVERFWNNQIILLPDDEGDPRDVLSDAEYNEFVANPRIRARAEGALRVSLLPGGGAGQAMIEVVRQDNPSAGFRDQMSRISDQSIFFKRHHDARWPDAFFGQASAAHEVGHWLHNVVSPLFEHEDADYAKKLTQNPGETAAQFQKRVDHEQYGHTLGKRVALMGGGDLLTEYDAGPWLSRIRRHTHRLGWTYMHRVNFGMIQADITPRQRALVHL